MKRPGSLETSFNLSDEGNHPQNKRTSFGSVQSSSSDGSVAINREVGGETFIQNLMETEIDRKTLLKCFEDLDSLYLLAFDCGQANFMVVAHNNEVVIIDAGGRLAENEQGFFEDFMKDKKIKQVFVTHPDFDHFSLFSTGRSEQGFLEKFSASFSGCEFYLGGSEQDWTETKQGEEHLEMSNTQRMIDNIGRYVTSPKIHYVEDEGKKEIKSDSFSIEIFDVLPLQRSAPRLRNKKTFESACSSNFQREKNTVHWRL